MNLTALFIVPVHSQWQITLLISHKQTNWSKTSRTLSKSLSRADFVVFFGKNIEREKRKRKRPVKTDSRLNYDWWSFSLFVDRRKEKGNASIQPSRIILSKGKHRKTRNQKILRHRIIRTNWVFSYWGHICARLGKNQEETTLNWD